MFWLLVAAAQTQIGSSDHERHKMTSWRCLGLMTNEYRDKSYVDSAGLTDVNGSSLSCHLRRCISNEPVFPFATCDINSLSAITIRRQPNAGLTYTTQNYFYYKPWRSADFSIWNHHKCLYRYFFLVHLNTYVICLHPLEIIILILSVRGPSLYVRFWRLQTSDSDV